MATVSVIIPYKNNLEYLYLSINSVLNQTFKSFRILIIYDDEKKNDLKKIKKFISESKKKKKFQIKIIINKKNLGAGESRNKGIKFSKSKYIAFLDSDDTWRAQKLQKQVDYMETFKVPMTHTSYNIINEKGKKISIRKANYKSTYREILNSCDVGLSTVMINSKFIKDNNLKFPKITTKEDYILWLRILKKTQYIIGLNSFLTNYRKRKNSLSSNIIINILNGFKVYKEYEEMSNLKSLYRLSVLSINFFKKKFLSKFNS